MFSQVGLFDEIRNAPVEIGEYFIGRFGEFVFAVVDVVGFENLEDSRWMILPGVFHCVAQFRFDIAHYFENFENNKKTGRRGQAKIQQQTISDKWQMR